MTNDTRELTQVMVDIETLGREPGAAVISLGAAEFSELGVGETFFRNISLESCADAGLDIEAETLGWWLDQGDAAQDQLSGGEPLAVALDGFTSFYGDADEIWANAPAFDCEILEAAYHAVDRDEPWSFRDERCHRTLREFPQLADVDDVGDEHNAEDDALYQARVAHQTLTKLGYYST
jgi:hypothetical protein